MKLPELVRVAGRRWTVEEPFQAGKGLTGLDEHQVRRWTSWRRWTLFAMAAHVLLAVIAAHEHTDRPVPVGLTALTCNEIGRSLTVLLVEPSRVLACTEARSAWRRRHQQPCSHQPLPAPGSRPRTNVTSHGWSARPGLLPVRPVEETIAVTFDPISTSLTPELGRTQAATMDVAGTLEAVCFVRSTR